MNEYTELHRKIMTLEKKISMLEGALVVNREEFEDRLETLEKHVLTLVNDMIDRKNDNQ